jgi:hypothetical protein
VERRYLGCLLDAGGNCPRDLTREPDVFSAQFRSINVARANLAGKPITLGEQGIALIREPIALFSQSGCRSGKQI